MYFRFVNFQRCTFFLLSVICLNSTAYGDNVDERAVGALYTYLFLLTLSPDLSAANYTIEDEDGVDFNLSSTRLPYHIDLKKNSVSNLQLEIVAAYQQAEEKFHFVGLPGEFVDSEWNTYGLGLGLLYEHNISKQLRFTPSLRVGVATMKNDAIYNGVNISQLKDDLDGIFFNVDTNASVLTLGLGLNYNWILLDRPSSFKANIYHSIVDSFNEGHKAIKFTDEASMMALKADMIFPTKINMHDERLDLVLLLGLNHFFGENRHTLGYTTSYQAGVGAELPIQWKQKKYGYLRLSGQVLWADNMDGWMLSLGYNSY